jgi:hypothetical protein
MMNMKRLPVALAATLLILVGGRTLAGPKVDIVVGPKAPALERLAAKELAGLLRRLFEAEVTVTDKMPAKAGHRILLGSPKTNPAVGKAAGKGWPKLSDQGHLLRSVEGDGGTDLLVGGGSPVATLWAVYELGHHFGVRSFLHGDVMPAEPPTFKLTGLDVVREPALRVRTWRIDNDLATGPASWGLADQRGLVRQLAKLKFNRILLAFRPWQPFVHYEFKGVKKRTGLLWYGWRYRVDGDTAGRRAFRGADVFENPDFAGKTTYEQRLEAGIALARGVIDAAHERGMTADIAFSPLEFPREFAKALPKAKAIAGPERLTVGPGPEQTPDDAVLKELAARKVRAYLETYPKADGLCLMLPGSSGWAGHHEKAWQKLSARGGAGKVVSLKKLTTSARKRDVRKLQSDLVALEFFHHLLADPGLLKTREGKAKVILGGIEPALFPVLDKVLPPGVGALHSAADEILTLADDRVGVLPQLTTHRLHTLLGALRKHGREGYTADGQMPGDLNPAVYYLSRAGFDAKLTPERAYEELITPILGPGVSPRVIKGWKLIEEAAEIIDKNDPDFAHPVPGVVMKHYKAGAPPAWWKEARDRYAGAMNEMYRGIQRARGGARPVLLYHAKRLEFAFHYLNAIEAVRLAGQAKAAGDREKQRQQLEAATEAMYNALSAQADVARDQSDRGVIAVLNAYGYRPLQAELEAVEKAMEE